MAAFDFDSPDWSGQAVFASAGITVDEQRGGRAVLRAEVRQHQRGGGGTEAVNGAFLAYVSDLLLGTTASTAWGDQPTAQVTVSLNVSFLQPLMGSRLEAIGEVQRAGKRLCFVVGTIGDETGAVGVSLAGTVRRISAMPEVVHQEPAS